MTNNRRVINEENDSTETDVKEPTTDWPETVETEPPTEGYPAYDDR